MYPARTNVHKGLPSKSEDRVRSEAVQQGSGEF